MERQLLMAEDSKPISQPLVVFPESPSAFGADLKLLLRATRVGFWRLSKWLEARRPLIEALVDTWSRYHTLDRSGWLPHHTTPFHLLDPLEEDAEKTSGVIAEYYRREWPTIEAAFRSRIDGYDWDEETKATFYEALVAHRHGLYRAVPRTLFPDIERKVREAFFSGDLKPRTSLEEVRHAVGKMGFSSLTRTGVFSLKLYDKFADHLYSHVRTHEQLATVANDPVPNRHATLHGLVVYSTEKSSLNALIMAEFAHESISALMQLADGNETDS